MFIHSYTVLIDVTSERSDAGDAESHRKYLEQWLDDNLPGDFVSDVVQHDGTENFDREEDDDFGDNEDWGTSDG